MAFHEDPQGGPVVFSNNPEHNQDHIQVGESVGKGDFETIVVNYVCRDIDDVPSDFGGELRYTFNGKSYATEPKWGNVFCVDDERDRDGDLIPDVDDECPDEAENYNNYEDHDGCIDYPFSDNDQDNIMNKDDKCPDEAETYNNYIDWDGCPDDPMGDNDGDNIINVDDKCPDEAENYNNYEDWDGCWDEIEETAKIQVKDGRVEYKFAGGAFTPFFVFEFTDASRNPVEGVTGVLVTVSGDNFDEYSYQSSQDGLAIVPVGSYCGLSEGYVVEAYKDGYEFDPEMGYGTEHVPHEIPC